ncbi:hypothetical protein scyTo_0025963 [Scyliorhinus torazame]|uniref:Uncharacterized protein n=1 Tax=Scyliorhinus torazame TaxID=75743 RepID=A0A401QIY6_SCYTO|nr:hypothetical protein [Scyliorhinus torazame]
MAVVHSAASRDSVTGKSVGAEEEAIPSSDSRSRSDSRSGSDSSSDSSSDSDEETVTEDAGKSAAELPKRLPIHSSPGRAAEQTRERKEVERGGLVREPDEVCQDVNVPESKDSTSTGVSTCEERKAQTGHRESTRQGNRMMASSEICAGDKATVTTPGARSLPITKPVTEESTASSSLKEWLLPAPGERPEPEHKWAKEGTPEAGVPDMAAMPQGTRLFPPQQ